MDILIKTLYDAVEHLCMPLLNNDSEYCSVYEKTVKAQDAFCDAHSTESAHDFLDIINEYQHLGYLREQYFLIAGLHMGLELGSSNTLFSD